MDWHEEQERELNSGYLVTGYDKQLVFVMHWDNALDAMAGYRQELQRGCTDLRLSRVLPVMVNIAITDDNDKVIYGATSDSDNSQ